MLKAFAPKQRIPPSPNRNACNINAIVTERHAAHGPNNIASNADPTACAVVPPGTGTLNIMIKNASDAPIPN